MKQAAAAGSLLFFLGAFLHAQDHSEIFSRVQNLLSSKCIGCHGGDEPVAGMSLEPGHSYSNLVNVASSEEPALKRIRPNDLYNSYLFRKVLRDQTKYPFKEDGMPLDADPLSQEELNVLATWINSFPVEYWGQPVASYTRIEEESAGEKSDDFLATQLINLPTTRTLGRRTAEFRILHRFALMNGGGNATLRNFFGLDNGANTSINLSYAIGDNLDLLVRRTGFNKDIEVAVKYLAFRQRPGMPVSIGFYGGMDWISRSDVPSANRWSPNFQILAASNIHPSWSVLLVPSFAFRSNHEPSIRRSDGRSYRDTRYTMGLGMGSEFRIISNTAVVAEYLLRLDGYKGNAFAGDRRFNTWAVGLAHRIRLHVFEVVLTNNQGLHTTQFVPGSSSIGSASLFDQGPNFHFGFNIIRQFKW